METLHVVYPSSFDPPTIRDVEVLSNILLKIQNKEWFQEYENFHFHLIVINDKNRSSMFTVDYRAGLLDTLVKFYKFESDNVKFEIDILPPHLVSPSVSLLYNIALVRDFSNSHDIDARLLKSLTSFADMTIDINPKQSSGQFTLDIDTNRFAPRDAVSLRLFDKFLKYLELTCDKQTEIFSVLGILETTRGDLVFKQTNGKVSLLSNRIYAYNAPYNALTEALCKLFQIQPKTLKSLVVREEFLDVLKDFEFTPLPETFLIYKLRLDPLAYRLKDMKKLNHIVIVPKDKIDELQFESQHDELVVKSYVEDEHVTSQ